MKGRRSDKMKIFKKNLYPLTIIIVILILIGYLVLKQYLKEQTEVNNSITTSHIELMEEKEKTLDQVTSEKCSIDIKGAVMNPGVYIVDCNSNVNDVINTAGGLSNNADTSVINLAKKVSNEMVIIIYTTEEVKNSNIVDTVIKTVEKECICPNIQNDGCINNEITNNIGEDYQDNNTDNENSNGLININTATQQELQTISGIGESKAAAIIKYRETNGHFKTIEDILNVEGIGKKLYEEIKAYITT